MSKTLTKIKTFYLPEHDRKTFLIRSMSLSLIAILIASGKRLNFLYISSAVFNNFASSGSWT